VFSHKKTLKQNQIHYDNEGKLPPETDPIVKITKASEKPDDPAGRSTPKMSTKHSKKKGTKYKDKGSQPQLRYSRRVQGKPPTRQSFVGRTIFDVLESRDMVWVPSELLQKRDRWVLSTHTSAVPANEVPGHPKPPKVRKMTKKEEKKWRQQQRLPSNPMLERLRAYKSQLDSLDEDNQERDPNWIVKEVCGHCKYKDNLYVKVKWMNAYTTRNKPFLWCMLTTVY